LYIDIYIAILVFPIIFALIGLMGRSVGYALFPLLGGLIAAYCYLGIGSDGSLSSNFTGTANILATSGGNAFTWTAVILIPGTLAIICILIALGKVFKLI